MTNLTGDQRKALRRLGRGQTISRTMSNDQVIRQCYGTDHYESPPDLADMPYPQSMVAWCDWEGRARHQNRPRINEYGRKLLAQINTKETTND